MTPVWLNDRQREIHESNERQHAREREERQRALWKHWPKGKKKCEVVLRFIASHPEGLTEAEIRQFVWTLNQGPGRSVRNKETGKWEREDTGKAPPYYWMTLLRYPTNGKLSLLESWCERVSTRPNVWRFRKGQEIEPPFLKRDMTLYVTAGEYRRTLQRDPWQDGIRFHANGDGRCNGAARPIGPWDPDWQNTCDCPIPDEHLIPAHEVQREFRLRLGLKERPNPYYG